MPTWLQNNLGTIIVSAILLFVVALIILKMVRDKKKGKTSCGCGCDCCPSAGTCHKK